MIGINLPSFRMRISRLAVIASFVASLLFPSVTLALAGIGPRVSVEGTVQEIRVSEKQKWNEKGGEIILKATNGQIVTIVLHDNVSITSEGRMSRKLLLPVNITKGMLLRVRGWRVDTQSLTANLVVIVNIEKNPVLSLNGVLQTINGSKITVLGQDGIVRPFTLTAETNVVIGYELKGADALSLINKQVLLTLNPEDSSLVRVIRVTGNKELLRGSK